MSKRKPRAPEPEPRAPSRELVPWSGEQVDVDRFWAESWIDLLNRQRWLSKKLKLETAPWIVDQNAGVIQFERKDGALVTAPVQIIGAWNPRTEMFRSGWDHPMVVQRLRNDAERTRWFGDKHGLDELTEKALRMSEQEAWQMTALAMKGLARRLPCADRRTCDLHDARRPEGEEVAQSRWALVLERGRQSGAEHGRVCSGGNLWVSMSLAWN